MVGQNVGKYRVLDRIGRGGMGTVYRAHDETLDRDVAIKVLNPELNDPEVVRRFRAEAVTVARLNDPGIATIYELLQHDDQWLMVMEFVRGETLERLVDRAGALAPERAADLCTQALTALGHAHRMGVVHRDLKPANLMMTDSGAIKIMDFGIARVSGTDHLTQAGYMMGTPAYMAPEQVLGQEVDARADLYAMGVVLYRLVTGKLPFKGDTPFAMAQSQVKDPPTPIRLSRDSAPAWVEMVTALALAKSPADRFQSAEEFIHALRRGVSGFPIDVATTAIAPSGGSATTRVVAIDGTMPTGAQSTTASGAVAKHSTEPSTVTLKKRNLATLAVGAAVLVVVLIGVVSYLARLRTQNNTPAPASVTATPVPGPVPPPVAAPAPPGPSSVPASAPPPASAPAPVPSTPPVVAAKPDPSRAVPPGPVTTTVPPSRGRDVSSGSGTAVAPPAAGPVAPAIASDPHVAFVDVKMLEVKGNKAADQDVVLSLAAGQISLVSKKGGTALRSIPYAQLMHATYSRSKDPQWDSSLSSPPANLDIPGMFKTSRHWLALQTRSDYVIVRLADSNWTSILQTIESRTGVTIERRAASAK